MLGWIDDDVWFYRSPSQRPDFNRGGMYRVPAAGGPEELVLNVPHDCDVSALALDASGIACGVTEARRDLHVIDGFDPRREKK